MSTLLPIGSKALDFTLAATNGKVYSLSDFSHCNLLVIFFTCNHCPYVLGSDENTKEMALALEEKGVRFVAINSNAKESYPEDSFENMVARMQHYAFPWVYLYDETQQVAEAYKAVKTPHFFLFDKDRTLIYQGRSVDNPLDPSKASCNDLERAISQYLEKKDISTPLTDPIGCTIKWKSNHPHTKPPEACDIVQ